MAQYYGIHKYEEYNVEHIATLYAGLDISSRSKRGKEKYTVEQNLLMAVCDRLGWLVWSKTKDASRGRNKPKSIYEAMHKEKDEYRRMTIEEMEKWQNKRK